MPIHWGAFKLAIHKWTDPIERISVKAKELNVNLFIPEIGASILLDTAIVKENTNWWE